MSKKLPRGTIIELGGEPRINFLPGEIQQRKDARRRRRSLFMLVILVAVLCAIGYVYSAQYATERQAALEAEQQTTLNLLSQQAEFAEARTLANQVTTVGKAITHVTRNELRWRELINDLTEQLPPGVTLQQWTFQGPSSQEVAELSDGIFEVEIGGMVGLDILANNLSAIGTAIERLGTVPGVLVVNITSTSRLDDPAGYGTVLTVIVSVELYENRFSEGWAPGMTPIPEPTTPQPVEPAPEETEDAGDTENEEADQ